MAKEYRMVGTSWPADNDSAGNSSGQPEAADSLFCRLLADTRFTSVAVALPIGVTSLMVSCLVVGAVAKFKSRKPCNYFLVSLACSGILQTIVQLLVTSVNLFDDLFLFYHSSQNFCLARIALSQTAYFSSVTNAWFIAISHYLFLVQPINYYRLVTKRNTLTSIAFVWTFSIFYGMLAFGVQEHRRYSCCAVTEVVPRFYHYYFPLGHYTMCLAVCVFVYSTISCVSLKLRHKDRLERWRLSKGWVGSEDSCDDRSASWRTRKRRILQFLESLRSFRLFLGVIVIVLGIWGSYFFSRLKTEFGENSDTFGAHEEKEWYLSLVNSSTILLCSTYAYTNTEIRKVITILVFRRLSRKLRKKFIDDDAWLDINCSAHQLSDEANMFHALLCAMHIATACIVREPDGPGSSGDGRSGAENQRGLLQPVPSFDAPRGREGPVTEVEGFGTQRDSFVVEATGEFSAQTMDEAVVEDQPEQLAGVHLPPGLLQHGRQLQPALTRAASDQQLGGPRPLPSPDFQGLPPLEGAPPKGLSLSQQVGDHCPSIDPCEPLGPQFGLADKKVNPVSSPAIYPPAASDFIVVHFSEPNST